MSYKLDRSWSPTRAARIEEDLPPCSCDQVYEDRLRHLRKQMAEAEAESQAEGESVDGDLDCERCAELRSREQAAFDAIDAVIERSITRRHRNDD